MSRWVDTSKSVANAETFWHDGQQYHVRLLGFEIDDDGRWTGPAEVVVHRMTRDGNHIYPRPLGKASKVWRDIQHKVEAATAENVRYASDYLRRFYPPSKW